MKDNFNLGTYLTEGWMFKEAKSDLKAEGCHKVNELKREPKQATRSDLKGFATKSATLSREKRAQRGNWKGSVGKFVEDHRAEIDAAAAKGHGELRAYIVANMKPALSPEAQDYVDDELLKGYTNDRRLHLALYNIMLKGRGLGLHEEEDLEEISSDLAQAASDKAFEKGRQHQGERLFSRAFEKRQDELSPVDHRLVGFMPSTDSCVIRDSDGNRLIVYQDGVVRYRENGSNTLEGPLKFPLEPKYKLERSYRNQARALANWIKKYVPSEYKNHEEMCDWHNWVDL